MEEHFGGNLAPRRTAQTQRPLLAAAGPATALTCSSVGWATCGPSCWPPGKGPMEFPTGGSAEVPSHLCGQREIPGRPH